MKIYIDFSKEVITKVDNSVAYVGDVFSNTFEVLFYNYGADLDWFPTMSQLAPNGRSAGDFSADALEEDESHTYTEDGVTYQKFTFTIGDAWVKMKGRSNFYIWVNRVTGLIRRKCVGKVNVMLNESTENFVIQDPYFNPNVKEYIDNTVEDAIETYKSTIDDEVDAQNETIASLIQASPSVFDTASNITALTENKGVAVATDTGYIYYWDSTLSTPAYVSSGLQYTVVKLAGLPLQVKNENVILLSPDTLYIERGATSGVYFKWSGYMRFRGYAPNYDINYSSINSTYKTTSPNGVTDCVYVNNSYMLILDTDGTIKSILRDNVTDNQVIIFAVWTNVCAGGIGKYLYDDYFNKLSLTTFQKAETSYFVDVAQTTYFERAETNGVYVKVFGWIKIRGGVATDLAFSSVDSSYITTSPKGMTDCVFIDNAKSFIFDTTTTTLKVVSNNDTNVINGKYVVIFSVMQNKIVGGCGLWLYQDFENNKYLSLENKWGTDVPSIQEAQGKCFSIAIQTDTHIEPSLLPENYQNLKNLRCLTNEMGFDFAINLGDIISGYGTETMTALREDFTKVINAYEDNIGCPMLFAMGNHDDGCLNTETLSDLILPPEQYAKIITPIRARTNILQNDKSLYYYKDFDTIRVIVLNTRDLPYEEIDETDVDINHHAISNEQVQWFTNIALDTDKSVIVMCHVPLVSDVMTGTIYLPDNASNILTALQSFKNNGGKVIACMYGHVHAQRSATVNGILHITFANGSKLAELVFIDEANETITTKVIGDYGTNTDRSFSY